MTTAETLPLEFGTQRIAENEEDWKRLWHYFAQPAPPPRVDFEREFVVASVAPRICVGALPGVRACSGGHVELTLYPLENFEACYGPLVLQDPEPRWLWVIAVSRDRLTRASNARPAIPADPAEELPGACAPEVPGFHLTERRRAAWRERTWLDDIHWQTGAGILAGASPAYGGAVGAELRGGIRYDLHSYGRGEGLVGDLIGIDLRTRWARTTGVREDRFFVGLSPWMMMSDDWVFHRAFSRQPTFIGVFIPEGGLVMQRGRSVGGYLGWSLPIAFRLQRYFFRTSPYVLAEHWALEVAPAALLLFEPEGRSLLFTVTASAGLW